jgi:hypothetical protein
MVSNGGVMQVTGVVYRAIASGSTSASDYFHHGDAGSPIDGNDQTNGIFSIDCSGIVTIGPVVGISFTLEPPYVSNFLRVSFIKSNLLLFIIWF